MRNAQLFLSLHSKRFSNLLIYYIVRAFCPFCKLVKGYFTLRSDSKCLNLNPSHLSAHMVHVNRLLSYAKTGSPSQTFLMVKNFKKM